MENGGVCSVRFIVGVTNCARKEEEEGEGHRTEGYYVVQHVLYLFLATINDIQLKLRG